MRHHRRPLWKRLEGERRERLFALMRELDAESHRYFAKGREDPDPSVIPVGAAFFDETLRGAVRMELCIVLGSAKTLEEAEEQARERVRLWVAKHNARRPKDVHWQRWTDAGQDQLRHLLERVRKAIA